MAARAGPDTTAGGRKGAQQCSTRCSMLITVCRAHAHPPGGISPSCSRPNQPRPLPACTTVVRLSGALAQGMLSAGNSSAIFSVENEYVLGNGGEPAPFLADLADAITYMVPRA